MGFAKSSFPYCERVFGEIHTTPSDCLSLNGNLLFASKKSIPADGKEYKLQTKREKIKVK
jgi:hypothetical protein